MRSLINSTIEDVAKKDQIGQKIIQTALDRQVKKDVDWTKIKSLETMALLRICRNQKAQGTLRSKDFSVKPIIKFSYFVAGFLPLQGSL